MSTPRALALILLFTGFFRGDAFSQTCGCARDLIGLDPIMCKPDVFSNGAKLYWQYNCDSAWLTFRSPNGTKRNLQSLVGEDEMRFTGSIGYSLLAEYPTSILLQYKMITGCCAPLEFRLLNKTTGRPERTFYQSLLFTETKPYRIIAFLGDNTGKAIYIYDVDTKKTYTHTLDGKLSAALKAEAARDASGLITKIEVKSGRLHVSYRTNARNEPLQVESITIHLKTLLGR